MTADRVAGLAICAARPNCVNNCLAFMAPTFVSFVAGGLLFLGSKWMAAAAFPVDLLIFMVRLPDVSYSQVLCLSRRVRGPVF